MGSKQIIITDTSLPDSFSDLPSDIIGFILDRLPIRAAVATSILSRDWRHKWRRIGNVIFDDEFANDVITPRIQGDSERISFEYGNIIGRILLLHIGPIQKFVIHIPFLHGYTLPSDLLGSWMLFISQNEVKELTIQAPYEAIILPSYLFHSNELQHLKLDVHTLEIHPHDFSGFCNLLSLDFSVFKDGGVISNLISKCHRLEKLSLLVSLYTHPFVIDAPRLHFLNAFSGMDSDVFLTLKNSPNVAEISLVFGRFVMDFCYLISIFGSVPKVETVVIYLPQTLVDMPPDAPMSLPTTLHNHKSLTLLHVDISSLECIYFVLCVLKSSPNLQTLNLEILPSDTSEDEDAVHLLDMQIRGGIQTMKSLLTVKMKGLFGSKIDVMLIKLILSFSPVLKTMFLTGKYTRDSWLGKDIINEAEFTLMAELLQCPRSSCQAQVIYSRYPGDSSIIDFYSL